MSALSGFSDPQNAPAIDQFVCESGEDGCTREGYASCWSCNSVLCVNCTVPREGHEWCREHAPMLVPRTETEAYEFVQRIEHHLIGSGWDERTSYALDLGNILWDFKIGWNGPETDNCAVCGLPFWLTELTDAVISGRPRKVCNECQLGRLVEKMERVLETEEEVAL